jgi:hypothetical protein
MKKIISIMVLMALSASLYAQDSGSEKEKELIMKVIQTAYVEGLQNEGDTVKINSGFHPGFEMLMPMKDGTLGKYSLGEWKARIKNDLAEGKLPRKPEKKISVRFLFVDITGSAAVAKFEFYVGGQLTFIDYQSLYKFGDQWKIVSKTYQKL